MVANQTLLLLLLWLLLLIVTVVEHRIIISIWIIFGWFIQFIQNMMVIMHNGLQSWNKFWSFQINLDLPTMGSKGVQVTIFESKNAYTSITVWESMFKKMSLSILSYSKEFIYATLREESVKMVKTSMWIGNLKGDPQWNLHTFSA